jgi:hypothetical protein
MSATSAITRGRVAAEALMLDACTVTRVGSSSTDPETGVITPTLTTVYTGKCKVQQAAVPSGSPTDIGEASVQLLQLQVHLPVSAVGVQADDTITVTASALDPELVGRVFVVRGTAHKSYLTARRLAVQEADS